MASIENEVFHELMAHIFIFIPDTCIEMRPQTKLHLKNRFSAYNFEDIRADLKGYSIDFGRDKVVGLPRARLCFEDMRHQRWNGQPLRMNLYRFAHCTELSTLDENIDDPIRGPKSTEQVRADMAKKSGKYMPFRFQEFC